MLTLSEIRIHTDALKASVNSRELQLFSLDPGRHIPGRARPVEPAEHENVGDDRCAGDVLERIGGKSDRTDEIGDFGDRLARAAPLGVEGACAGDRHDPPTRFGQMQALEEERVVDRVVLRIPDRIRDRELAERDVADDCIKAPFGHIRHLEALESDLCVRVQKMSHLGSDRVFLDADHDCVVRGQGDEGARAGSRFQDATGIESGAFERVPHRSGDSGVGVVRVESRCSRIGPLLGPKQ